MNKPTDKPSTLLVVDDRQTTMEGEFSQTRAFLRQCMNSVVHGELNHQRAQDIAMLAKQQNYNMALEATLFPRDARGVSSQKLLDAASVLISE